MKTLIVVFGIFLGSVSIIKTQHESYADYSVPRDCELNERRPSLVDPHSFYWCLVDGPVLMKCVAGTYFDVTEGMCVVEEVKESPVEIVETADVEEIKEVRCPQTKITPKGIICPMFDPVDRSIYYPDPHACECFYQCDNRVAKRIPCREGLHFNATTNLCDWPEEAGCEMSLDGYKIEI